MTLTNNVWAIVRKEWRHYFGSPIAYVALVIWTLLFGGFFALALTYFLDASQSGGGMRFGGLSLNERVIAPVLHNMSVVTLFLTPMLTMRLFAEEKRQGTIELLATSPITDLEIVLGKFLGALGFFATMLAAGCLNFAILWTHAIAAPDWRPALTGALGLLLLGSAFIAVGLFISTLTKNQIIAGAVTFGALLAFWMLGWLGEPGGESLRQVVAYLGIVNHLEDLTKGVLDLKDVVFYLTFTLFGLFLAEQSVESHRWRA